MSSSDHQEVADVLDRYADGLYSANPAVLRTVFHDHLNYVNASPCSFTTQGLRDYMNVVGRRVSPDRLVTRAMRASSKPCPWASTSQSSIHA